MAVPVWSGCWSHKTRQSDQLFLVNYKLPFQTSTTTQYNPWLAELSQHHPRALAITLSRATATRLGIADKEEIELVGVNGHAERGVARLSGVRAPGCGCCRILLRSLVASSTARRSPGNKLQRLRSPEYSRHGNALRRL